MLNIITDREPKNPTTAARLAKRWEGAKQITREGYYFLTDEFDVVTVCKPGTGWAYTIGDPMEAGAGCNCPDFVKHGDFCKHTLAYQGREEILMEFEAEECGMDKETYRRWKEANEAQEAGYAFC